MTASNPGRLISAVHVKRLPPAAHASMRMGCTRALLPSPKQLPSPKLLLAESVRGRCALMAGALMGEMPASLSCRLSTRTSASSSVHLHGMCACGVCLSQSCSTPHGAWGPCCKSWALNQHIQSRGGSADRQRKSSQAQGGQIQPGEQKGRKCGKQQNSSCSIGVMGNVGVKPHVDKLVARTVQRICLRCRRTGSCSSVSPPPGTQHSTR